MPTREEERARADQRVEDIINAVRYSSAPKDAQPGGVSRTLPAASEKVILPGRPARVIQPTQPEIVAAEDRVEPGATIVPRKTQYVLQEPEALKSWGGVGEAVGGALNRAGQVATQFFHGVPTRTEPSTTSVAAPAQPPIVLPPAASRVVVPAASASPETAVAVRTAAQPEQLSGPTEPTDNRPIHERFATPREAYRGMSDTEFKRFVDEHKHIPGIGYVENEKGKIERIIPSSFQSREASPDLTPEQLQAMTGLLGVQNQARAAAASEARLGLEGRRADLADRRTALTEQRYADMTKLERDKLTHDIDKLDKSGSLKEPMNYVKALEMFSPDEVDEFGMKTGKKNYPAGGEVLTAMGYPVPKGMKIPTVAAGTPKKGEKKQSPSGKIAVYDGTKWVFEK
jgi:hypothetical protein